MTVHPFPLPSSLGIDPGWPGAAVLLDSAGAVAWACEWVYLTRKSGDVVRVRSWAAERPTLREEKVAPRASAVGQHLFLLLCNRQGPLMVTCEDAFVGSGPTANPRTAVMLACMAGGVTAPLEVILDTKAAWVLATVWRRTVLGLSVRTRSEEAKAASLRYLPLKAPGLAEALSVLGPTRDHISDAAGIALWRRALLLQERQGWRA